MSNQIRVDDGDTHIFYPGRDPYKGKRLTITFKESDKWVKFHIDQHEIKNNDLMGLLKVIEFKAKRAQEQLANPASRVGEKVQK